MDTAVSVQAPVSVSREILSDQVCPTSVTCMDELPCQSMSALMLLYLRLHSAMTFGYQCVVYDSLVSIDTSHDLGHLW